MKSNQVSIASFVIGLIFIVSNENVRASEICANGEASAVLEHKAYLEAKTLADLQIPKNAGKIIHQRDCDKEADRSWKCRVSACFNSMNNDDNEGEDISK